MPVYSPPMNFSDVDPGSGRVGSGFAWPGGGPVWVGEGVVRGGAAMGTPGQAGWGAAPHGQEGGLGGQATRWVSGQAWGLRLGSGFRG